MTDWRKMNRTTGIQLFASLIVGGFLGAGACWIAASARISETQAHSQEVPFAQLIDTAFEQLSSRKKVDIIESLEQSKTEWTYEEDDIVFWLVDKSSVVEESLRVRIRFRNDWLSSVSIDQFLTGP